MSITNNPDQKFVENKKKEIKRNNGYCKSAMGKGKDYKCKCKRFLESTVSCWCDEGLYYNDVNN